MPLLTRTMAHSRIDSHEFKRRNGAFKLTVLADSEVGLPYGSIPRLLMSWITTEAVKTKQRELILRLEPRIVYYCLGQLLVFP